MLSIAYFHVVKHLNGIQAFGGAFDLIIIFKLINVSHCFLTSCSKKSPTSKVGDELRPHFRQTQKYMIQYNQSKRIKGLI